MDDTDADADGDTTEPCDPIDSDRDTVPDADESLDDADGDGLPNTQDIDDDGDGVPTYLEAGDEDPCTPPANSDADGVPDFLDLDSDGDDLSDAEEARRGTDRAATDTDGDCFPDGAEVAFGTDPVDGSDRPQIPVVVLANGAHDERQAEFQTPEPTTDVVFAVDTTGSTAMYATMGELEETFRDVILPGLESHLGDVEVAVVELEDFAYGEYGDACEAGGALDRGKDHAFHLLQPATDDPDLALAAIDLLDEPAGCGGDAPQSYVEALYQIATGEGIARDGDAEDFAPAVECEPVDGEAAPRIGGACFRPGALPLVLLFGASEFHNGPPDGTTQAYGPIDEADPEPHTWPEAIDALVRIGAKVIGFHTEDFGDALDHMERTAAATATLSADGTPLAVTYPWTAVGLADVVVDTVASLEHDVRRSWRGVAEDGDGDGFDATAFVRAVHPSRADPADAVKVVDDTRFWLVEPRTRLTFDVELANYTVEPREVPTFFRVAIVFVDVADVAGGRWDLMVEVPSRTGETCE